MTRNWFLIDKHGCHRITLPHSASTYTSAEESSEEYEDVDADNIWPEFLQLAVHAPAHLTREVFVNIMKDSGVILTDVTARPDLWDDDIYLAHVDPCTVLAEPHTDPEQQSISGSAEQVLKELHSAGALFGHDPSHGTLHLTMFQNGAPVFSWCDSLVPGPSYALVFHADGTCTYEDPRLFALRILDLPESTPFLDRYAFIEANLRGIGIQSVCVDVQKLPLVAVFQKHEATLQR